MTTIAELEKALQQAWNESIGDTGCIPDDFTVSSPRTAKVTAIFLGGSFAGRVQAWLTGNKKTVAVDSDLHEAREWLANGPREGSKTATAVDLLLNAYDTQRAELVDLRKRITGTTDEIALGTECEWGSFDAGASGHLDHPFAVRVAEDRGDAEDTASDTPIGRTCWRYVTRGPWREDR